MLPVLQKAGSQKGWVMIGPSLLFVILLSFSLSQVALSEDAGLMTPETAWQKAENGELLIIDIRTQDEWDETGIAPDAALVSLYSDWGIPNLEFVTEILAALDGDKDKPFALICAGGVRTAFAADLLRDRGFSQVFDIGEGMLGSGDGPGWLARGLPTRECSDCT